MQRLFLKENCFETFLFNKLNYSYEYNMAPLKVPVFVEYLCHIIPSNRLKLNT